MRKDNYQQIWAEIAQNELGKKKLSSLYKDSLEGINIQPFYSSQDINNISTLDEMIPGKKPFIRGAKATMYCNKPWTIRQYAGFSTAKESNQFYKKCLKNGQKGLSIAFDLPTHRGYDSDHSKVVGDVGKAGVAIDSVEDMKVLFAGIDLDKISVSMTMNGAVLPILASYIVVARESGANEQELRGTIQNDILKEFMVRNTFIYPPKSSLKIVADIIAYTSKHMPKFNPISISGYHIHEAGADLALELGLTLANGLEYVRTALNTGLKIDQFAPRLSFFFATGMNFYMEIAKLRAARLLWCKLIKQFKPKNNKSLILRTHCQTSGWSLTAQSPHNNIIRTTIEAMAAIFGGTQSLHTNSFDEALALPSPFAASISRNTQIILQEETGITNVVDPFGGSYFMEKLTHQLADKAQTIIDNIENAGGMIKAIEQGLPSLWIEQSAIKRQALIDSNQETVVGVNKYQDSSLSEVEILQVDASKVRNEQIDKLKQVKKNRNNELVQKLLNQLTKCAKDNKDNLLEISIKAAAARATVGEMSLALEKAFTRYEAKVKTAVGIYKKYFCDDDNQLDNFIKDVKEFEKIWGRRPKILIAKLGQDGHDRGAKVVASAFADFGFDVDIGPLFQSPEEVANHAIKNDVHAIGISTLAGAHKILIPKLIDILGDSDHSHIKIITGGIVPKQDYPALLAKGVVEIFSPATVLIDAAKKVLNAIQKNNPKTNR